MRQLVGAVSVLLLGPAGCEPEPSIVVAEFGEVCGEPGPFRILPLRSDEFVDANRSLRANDRSLLFVRRFEPSTGEFLSDEGALWSVGSCGESPVLLAPAIQSVFAPELWPGTAVGCEPSTGDVFAFDVTGATAPWVVMPAARPDCAIRWTEFGALSAEAKGEALGRLVLQRFPADPRDTAPDPVVLLEEFRLAPGSSTDLSIYNYLAGALYYYKDHAIALRPDGTLVRVDLADGTVSMLQTGVSAFEAASDGETVIWQDSTVIAADDPEYPVGEVFLRAPDGQNTSLGETSLAFQRRPLALVRHGIVELRFGVDGPRRLFLLPDFATVEIPSDLVLVAPPLPDGRFVATVGDESMVEIVDLRANVRAQAFPRPAQVLRIHTDALDVLDVAAICCGAKSMFWNEGPIWRVPIDGSPATRIAARATGFVRELDDDRLVSPVALGRDQRGELIFTAPKSADERLIDEQVHMFSLDWSRVAKEGIVSYSVADGARSGVYLANLSAEGASP